MRFLFKTDYEDDIKLFPHSGYFVSYGLLLAVLLIAPYVLSSYLMSQLVFVCIYATVGVALLILTGFTGQASLGHAAFLAIGAYTAAYLQKYGVPFPVYFLAAGLLTGLIGALVGFPALRLQGIYLVIATISFAFIVEEILARWESVTNGNEGMRIKAVALFGVTVSRDSPTFYFLCLALLVLTIVGTLNLLRSPTGRAFVAIRDSETAARSMGVNVALYKVKSFAISAAITGFAGVLFAHKLSFISPEMFTLQLSIEFIIVILIGGTFSLHGAVLGAIFIVMIDPLPDLPQGRHARHHRRHCRDVRSRHARRGQHSVQGRGLRLAQWPERRDLRHHYRIVRAVRAARALRPLAEDKTLLPAVPTLQARHLQAAEDLCEVGAQPMSYFRAENLSLHFGGLKAVDAVSFAVERGEILSIIGPNGAGKSSIFNLISRIYRPTSGRIFFEDQDITEQPPYDIARLGIARTFQNIELFENATVLSNLLVGRHRHSTTQLWQELLFLPSVRAGEKLHRRRVEQVIEFLDLEPYRDKLISGLPYGVRKVIELARALCSEPKLILLDEPSSGLNVEETDGMSFWIRDLKNDLGVTVLMVEHDMSLVNRVSDRVIALNYGRVLATGSPAPKCSSTLTSSPRIWEPDAWTPPSRPISS
ncbi:ABC-type branched-subunit amino acid transport system ATPase component/ABC-type branched-subunit amino acid transport system permease subunit [Bradyrhizobium sp. LB1.3]